MKLQWTYSRAASLKVAVVAAAVLLSAPALGSDEPTGTTTGPPGGTAAAPVLAESQREAQALLKDMADYLASLQSFTVKFRGGYDVVQSTGQKIEYGETRRITLARPNQLRVEQIASDGRLDLVLFDGKDITAFNADANVFARAPQPGTVDDALVYFVRDLRMRMPLARLLTTRLPTEWPKRVQTVDYVESADIDGVLTHHVAGRTDAVDFQYWITDGPAPVAAARRPDLRGRTGPAAVLGEPLAVGHESAAGEDRVPVRSPGGRTPDHLCRPGFGIHRRTATGCATQGGQAMTSRKSAGPGIACLVAISTLALSPFGDAFAARPERGGSGGDFSKEGPAASGSMSQRGGGRSGGRSAQASGGTQRPAPQSTGSSAQRQGSRDENQGQRQASHDENQSQRQDNADDVREDREDYYEDRYDDWDGYYDDDNEELVAGLVVGAVVGAAAASADDDDTPTTTTTTTTVATTSAALPCNPSVSTVQGVTYYQCGQQYYVQAYGGSGPIYMPTQPPK